MNSTCDSLVAAYQLAQDHHVYALRIHPIVNGHPDEDITLKGHCLFLENVYFDYRAKLLLQVVLPGKDGSSDYFPPFSQGASEFQFEKASENSTTIFSLDITEVCKRSKCDPEVYLPIFDRWICDYLIKRGRIDTGTSLTYRVEGTDKPYLDDENKCEEFVYLDEENLDVSSDHCFESGVLEDACYDFLQAVFESDPVRRDSDGSDYNGDDFFSDVQSAYSKFAKRSDDCRRFEYLFSDEYRSGGLIDLLDSFESGGSCFSLPLFPWYELAFQENPFLSETNSLYWTTVPAKAKEFIDELFKQDAETLNKMTKRVRKSVAAGKASAWLSRTNNSGPDTEIN